MMKFSMVQQKEMIEAGSGKFIGYIVDAEVNEKSGHIEYFLLHSQESFIKLFKGKKI